MRVAWVVLGLIAANSFARQEAAPPVGTPFQSGQISIGAPVTLPFGAPPAGPSAGDGNGAVAFRTGGEPAATVAPRSGWLGMVVAESNVPGRWRVDEVAAGGPADVAGIRAGDELRAVNGVAPRNADEVAQALTAIVADQPVRVAIGRGDEVSDVILRPAPRPTAAPPPPFAVATPAPAPSDPTLPPLPDGAVPMAAAPPAVFEPVPTQAPRFRSGGAASTDAAVPETGFGPASPVSPAWSATLGASAAPQARRPGSGAADAAAIGAVAGSATPVTAPGRRTALGVRTIPIDPVTQARFQLTEPVGAYVIGVVQDLPASRAGVPPGSVIVAIDRRPVLSPAELTSLVMSSPVDRPITVRFLLPGGTSRDAAVMLQSIDPPLLQALEAHDPAPSVPASGGRVARRPVEDAVSSLRREIGVLRASLEQLERRLEGLTAGRR